MPETQDRGESVVFDLAGFVEVIGMPAGQIRDAGIEVGCQVLPTRFFEDVQRNRVSACCGYSKAVVVHDYSIRQPSFSLFSEPWGEHVSLSHVTMSGLCQVFLL